jgi:hypothetical protein
MTGKATAKITRVSKEAWQVVQTHASSTLDSPPPVSLSNCAKAFGVRCIRFEPLISDAGLARSGKDLEILINTEVTEDTYPAGTTLSVDDTKWLDFAPSLRFTIAHEIAHAAFLETAGWDKESDLAQKNRRAIENGCSILARSLLLPRKMLLRELGDRFFDVDHISNLLTAFRVSPEVFIRRLHLSDLKEQFANLDGFLAFAQDTQGTIRVKACHVVGSYARDRFHDALKRARREPTQPAQYRSLSVEYVQAKWALEGCPLTDLNRETHKDIESLVRNNESGRLGLEVGWTTRDVIPCDLAFRRIHHQPLGLLVRVQVIGPVQKPSQRPLF